MKEHCERCVSKFLFQFKTLKFSKSPLFFFTNHLLPCHNVFYVMSIHNAFCSFVELTFEFIFFFLLTYFLNISTMKGVFAITVITQMLLFVFYLYIAPKFGESIAGPTAVTPFTSKHLRICVLNFAITLFMLYCEFTYVMERIKYHETPPMWLSWLIVMPVCIIVDEVWFYYLHRLGHHPKLYKRIHKYHHAFQVSSLK
jgi:sterol desaturase/sphingolipid hydroxylase (fatty acid hydroxylase superfamily)